MPTRYTDLKRSNKRAGSNGRGVIPTPHYRRD